MINRYYPNAAKFVSPLLTAWLGGSLVLAAAETPERTATSGAAQVRAASGTNCVMVSVAGKAVLSLQLPAGAEVKTEGERTSMRAADAHLYLQLWPLAKARTVEEGAGLIPDLLAAKDVTGFKATVTNHITVAGAPALHLVGGGKEQDDGDPSQADVVVFSSGSKIFAACVHGEERVAAEVTAMLKVLESARLPGPEKPADELPNK